MGKTVEYLAVESPIHRLNPLTKLSGILSIFLLGLLFTNPLILLGIIITVFMFYFVAGAGKILAGYLKPLLAVSLFILLVQILFSHQGPEIFRYLPEKIPVLGRIGVVNKESLMLGLTITTRMGVFAFSLPLLLATTQPRDLILVLVEKLRLPYDYAFMFITALRFIPALFIEMDHIFQAQSARGFDISSQPLLKRVKSYLPLVVPLVMISLKKAERLAVAMETRGYGLRTRTYLRKSNFNSNDGIVCFVLCCLVILSVTFKALYRV